MTRPDHPLQAPPALDFLPTSLQQAAFRGGVRGMCPRCGEARLFRRWLKPVDRCPHCGQDWSLHSADDFPPYVSIFLTGHLMAPVIILLILDGGLSMGMVLALILPLAIGLMLGILQPAKGAIIALQWWLGMGQFRRERRAGDEAVEAP